jgi:poly(ADP-ribose) glycohydrolase ARH3
LSYTDDTAMALALGESLLARGDVDEQHLGETFHRHYWREPWRGYGPGPPRIFATVMEEKISYREAARRLYGGNGSLGNGAAMRIAPLGLFFSRSSKLVEKARLSAAVTHVHPVGMDGAAVQALAIAHALTLEPSQSPQVHAFLQAITPPNLAPALGEKLAQVESLLAQQVAPPEAIQSLGSSIRVDESLPFALYAFLRYPCVFEDCLWCAVLNGGDRDTLGAMAGAVCGAFLGVEAIPAAWRAKLENATSIETLALDLLQQCGRDEVAKSS